jgi:hypothetical protein
VGPDGSNLLKIEETGGRLTVCDTGEIHIWAPTKAHWEAAAGGVRQVEGANLKEGEVYSVRVRHQQCRTFLASGVDGVCCMVLRAVMTVVRMLGPGPTSCSPAAHMAAGT